MIALDHLVIAAATRAEGAVWCERRFGITPAAGGRHVFMGTHNVLFSVASERFPKAYAEIIAIDPSGAVPARPRWFDLDDAALRSALQADGPHLVHWVARSPAIEIRSEVLRSCGIEPGELITAERGTLRWRIGLRADGKRLFGGALPALIEWGDAHPSEQLPAGDVELLELQLTGLPEALITALGGVPGVCAYPGAGIAPIRVRLRGPRGEVALASWQGAG